MDFATSLKYLYSLGHEVLAAKFGLESIGLLLEKLGHPERSFKSVIVAGTNGKGSVAAMVDSIVRAAGYKAALYTSPHLVRIQERIHFCGREISESDFAQLASEVRDASESLVVSGRLAALPTFFEQVTAIALRYSGQCKADLAVLEIGVGGQFDAVNIAERIAAIITSIDFDHQNILGATIEEIASVKAGVITPELRVVIGRQRHEAALDVLMRRCLELNALPVFANEPTNIDVGSDGRVVFDYESARTSYWRIGLGLRGRHQAENAAAAIQTAELLIELGFDIRRAAIIEGLREVSWPGRLELIDDRPRILLDGAHNTAGAGCLRAYLDEFWNDHVTLIFGSMNDKNIPGIASELFGAAKTIVLTRLNDPRAASNATMGRVALCASRNVIFTDSVRQALSWARRVTPADGLICAAGSLRLIGEVKHLIEAEGDTVQSGNK